MKKIILRSCLMFGIALFSLISFFNASFGQTITLSSPVSGSLNKTFTLTYALSESPKAGTVSLMFTSSGATRTVNLNNSLFASFLINPTLDLAATYPSHIVSVTGGTSIPDDTYSVSISYQRNLSNNPTITSSTKTGVVIDTVTTAPTLTTPATGANYTSLIPIQYTVPESALSNSRVLTFSSGSNTVILNLKDTALASFSLDPTQDPANNSNVLSASGTSIPDGTYSVTFSYQDALANPAASSTSNSVVIGSIATPTPTAAIAPVSSDSGGGCGTITDQRKKKSIMPYESFFWMIICVGFVLALRNRRALSV